MAELSSLCEWLCGVREMAELGAPIWDSPSPSELLRMHHPAGTVPMAGRPPVTLGMGRQGFEGLFGGLFLPSTLCCALCVGVEHSLCFSDFASVCSTSVLLSFLLQVVAAWCENPWGGNQDASMEHSVTVLLLVGNLIAKKKKKRKKVISYISSGGLG